MLHFSNFSMTCKPIPRLPPVITTTRFGSWTSSVNKRSLRWPSLPYEKNFTTQLILLRFLKKKSSFWDRSPQRIVFTSNLNSHQDFGNSFVVRKKKKSKIGWRRMYKMMSSMLDYLRAQSLKWPPDGVENYSDTEVVELDIQVNRRKDFSRTKKQTDDEQVLFFRAKLDFNSIRARFGAFGQSESRERRHRKRLETW